jgi:1,5-anhydro-D-fructose reductase (1,5-anhydro-D-mannitol-forming)
MIGNEGTVRWGIIGCGDVCEHKSGPPLYQTPGSELVAVMRRSADKTADFARRHGARRWYTDVDALLADPEINAVYVASPHGLHYQHVAAAAKAGKAILCEKPMGANAQECQAIVELCRQCGVPLDVAYYRRYWPVVRKMKALLADGAIGRIAHVRVQLCDYFAGDDTRPWLTQQAQAGGGALANAGSHWIDLIRFLIGEVTDIQAYASSALRGFEVDDTTVLILRVANGALVTFSASWGGASINDFDVTGTHGRLLASALSAGQLVLERRGHETEWFNLARSGPAHREYIEDLISRLRTGAGPSIPGEEAVAAWRIIEAAYQSGATHENRRA